MLKGATLLIPIALLYGMAVAGCAETGQPDPAGKVVAERPTPVSGSPEDIALSTVAVELGISIETLSVSSSEAVNFRDASLGCPQPGMAYPQVITPGHRIVITGEGRSFDVRVSGSRGRICEKPAKPAG